jgi:hypothetical protein
MATSAHLSNLWCYAHAFVGVVTNKPQKDNDEFFEMRKLLIIHFLVWVFLSVVFFFFSEVITKWLFRGLS